MLRRYVIALGIARAVAGLALLIIGAIHLDEYALAHYSAIPTIGWLFLVNFAAATAFGLVLIAPVNRARRRWREWLDTAAALGGMGVAWGSLVALLLSERAPIFGFMEHGYRPLIVITIVADAVAITALSAVIAWTGGAARQGYPLV